MRLNYIPQNEARIRALRVTHWGNDKHPDSWFGPAFPQVAAEADRRVGSEYARFYVDHYDRLCWGTHGTTLMLVRAHPPDMLPSVACMALIGSLQLAMDLTSRALVYFGEDERAIGDTLAGRMLHAKNELRIARLTDIVNSAT